MTIIDKIRGVPSKFCLIGVSLLLISIMLGCASEPEVEREYTVISAMELYEKYLADSVTADVEFYEEWLEITGVMLRVGVHQSGSLDGRPFAVLTADPSDPEENVLVNFRKADKPQLDELVEGETVTMRGKCIGISSRMTVTISQGVIVE
ncbi:hypothetical protein ACFLXP_04715 [Chloroflexota bacterium]